LPRHVGQQREPLPARIRVTVGMVSVPGHRQLDDYPCDAEQGNSYPDIWLAPRSSIGRIAQSEALSRRKMRHDGTVTHGRPGLAESELSGTIMYSARQHMTAAIADVLAPFRER
jgi:hypothetical protein